MPNRPRAKVLDDVLLERQRQDAKFGPVRGMDLCEWMCVLMEEVGEAAGAVHETVGRDNIRKELIQVAAVAVNIVEHMDRGDA